MTTRGMFTLMLALGAAPAVAEPYRPLPRVSRKVEPKARWAPPPPAGDASPRDSSAGRPAAEATATAPATVPAQRTPRAADGAVRSLALADLSRVEARAGSGRTVEVLSDGAGDVLEIVRDAEGRIVSARTR